MRKLIAIGLIPRIKSQQRLLEGARALSEGKIEGRATARVAGRANYAAVVLNNVFNDGESKPRPALLARAGLVHAIEALEDSFEGFRRYSRTVILNEHFHPAAVSADATNSHRTLGAAVFDGVIHQIPQHLFQSVNVRTHGKLGGRVYELHALGVRLGLKVFKDLGNDGAERDGSEAQFDTAGLEFGNGEQILDEQFETLSVTVDGLQEFCGDLGVIPGAIEQRLDIAFDEGKRGAEFMTYIGHEFLAHALELFQAGQIVEDHHRAVPLSVSIEDGGSVDLQPAFAQPGQFELVSEHLFLRVEGSDQLGEFVQAKSLQEASAADINRHTKQAGKRAVGELNASVLIQEEQALDHAIEENFLLGLDLPGGPLLFILQGSDFASRGLPRAREPASPPKMQGCQGDEGEES